MSPSVTCILIFVCVNAVQSFVPPKPEEIAGAFKDFANNFGKNSTLPEQIAAAFKNFTAQFNKNYTSPAEFTFRATVFAKAVAFIEEMNKKTKDFISGLNAFSDMTFEEFKQKYLMPPTVNAGYQPPSSVSAAAAAPKLVAATSKNWNALGKVTRVKNQAQCGSCYAFSAIGALESALAIKGKPLTEYSEQEIVDCSSSYGNGGCNGGLMSKSYNYIRDKAVALGKDYLYKGTKGACSIKTQTGRVKVTGYKTLSTFTIDGLISAINTMPVAVAFEVMNDFMYYKSGIYKPSVSSCGSALNHGVLATGYYRNTASDSYIIVKNSWGTSWGEAGYVRMATGSFSSRGYCGLVNSLAVVPNV